MDLIRIATRQPITVSVAVLFCLLAGVVALKVVPVQMTPEVEDTIVAVTTSWENASPQEIESEIIDPQEEKLQGLSYLKSITSTSSSGEGVVRLEFNPGVSKEVALREVSDKLREVPSYPENVDEPVIEASDPESQDYIAWYILTSEDDSFDVGTLLDFAEDRIKPQLERVPGISEVNVLGGREREVQIRFDPVKLSHYGLSIAEFTDSIRKGNHNFSGGSLKQGKADIRIRTVGRFAAPGEILKVVVRRDENGPIYVADVATVHETFKEPLSYVRANGQKVLALNFQKEPGSNVLEIMEALQNKVEDLKKPGGLLDIQAQKLGLKGKLTLEISYRSTNYINQALALVQNNIFIGGSLAILVLLVFLRSVRSVGIIALSIPVSIIGAITLLVLLGRSINVVSLAGMAFAVGMVVDNCIVVLENIYRYLEMGKNRLEAAYEGTREVAGAVLASTLTTIVVFVPILLITDQVGQLFRDIALSIIISVGFSYLVSITVIPSASVLLLSKKDKRKVNEERKPLLYRFIHRINGSLLARIIVVLVFVSIAVVGTIALVPPLDYLPKGNRNITFGLMIPPPGYNLDQLGEMGKRVENIIRPYWEDAPNRPPVPVPYSQSGETVIPAALNKYFLVILGNMLFHGGISEDSRRAVDNVALFQAATTQENLPGTYAFAFQFPLFRIGGTTGSAIKINLAGSDLDQISASTGALFGSLMGKFGPGTLRPDPANFNVNQKELQITPNHLKLSELSMSLEDLGQAVQAVCDGLIVGDYDFSGDLIDLKLIAQNSTDLNYIGSLPQIPLASPTGEFTTLQNLGQLKWIDAPEQIKRVGRRRAVSLEVTPPDTLALEEAIVSINETIKQLRKTGGIAPGVEIEIEGTAGKLKEIRRTLFGDGTLSGTLGSSFFLAIAAVYLLMCVLFQSWTQPFIIMFSVPLATFGGFIGLALLHYWSTMDPYLPVQNLDMLTILGFVILIGVVVNNAILIVAQSNNLMRGKDKDGKNIVPMPARAAISAAVQSRVRPIFMSMLTSVGGMLPLVLIPGSGSELYRGLGSVVVGGMLVSTIFTLVLVPVLLSLTIGFFGRFKTSGRTITTVVLIGSLLSFVGCKSSNAIVEKDFFPPERWNTEIGKSSAGNLDQWWDHFNDPILTKLIQQATQNNLELAMALDRIERSRAILGQESSLKYPNSTIGGSYDHSKFTENVKNNFRSLEGLGNWDAFIQATWELDFIGRIRESISAAENDFLATNEDLYNLHVVISSDLTQNYLRYRSFQERESLFEKTLELQEENLRVVEARVKAGKATTLEVNNLKGVLALNQADLTLLQLERKQTLNRICLLLGETPGAVDSLLKDRGSIPNPTSPVDAGIPADLLRRRPDIRKAEILIDAEASRLEIVRTEYYPKFFLNGTIGLNSTYFNDLTTSGSENYSFGPNFEWRILNSRRIKEEVKAQEAQLKEQVNNYHNTVLQAMEEVESSLVEIDNEKTRLRQIKVAVEASEQSVELVRSLFANGLRNNEDVIQSLLGLQEHREQLILSKERSSLSQVKLYQALGGGWNFQGKEIKN